MEYISAKELFRKNVRFDLIYKILYLEHLNDSEENRQYYESLYIDSIRYFNGFYEKEPLKQSKEDFLNSFRQNYMSIKQKGYDPQQPIPINDNYQLYDGAHRLCIAYALNLDIPVRFMAHEDIFNYKFFMAKKMDSSLADIGALEYVKHNNNSYIAQVFPIVPAGLDDYIENVLNKYGFVYYKKTFHVNYNALVKIKQLNYGTEHWAGNKENDFAGLKQHALECLEHRKMRVYVFVAASKADTILAKKEIRDEIKKGNFPIHISDDHEETQKLAEIYFNPSGIDWLNSSPYRELPQISEIKSQFNEYCRTFQKDRNSICVSGSSILALYGLRKSMDIDCIHNDSETVEEWNLISSHDTEAKYYPDSFNHLVDRHHNYLMIDGIKFLTLKNMVGFKLRRHEFIKDYKDIYYMVIVKNWKKLKNNIFTYCYHLPRKITKKWICI